MIKRIVFIYIKLMIVGGILIDFFLFLKWECKKLIWLLIWIEMVIIFLRMSFVVLMGKGNVVVVLLFL